MYQSKVHAYSYQLYFIMSYLNGNMGNWNWSNFLFGLTFCREIVNCNFRWKSKVPWMPEEIYGRLTRTFREIWKILVAFCYIYSASRILCNADELLWCVRTSKLATCSYNLQERSTGAFLKLMKNCVVTQHSQGFWMCSGQVGVLG